MTTMFVNLPVTDLERAKAFYSAVGFTINPLFTDHNAACVVVEEDHNYFMIVTREFFSTFSDRPVGEPSKTVSASMMRRIESGAFCWACAGTAAKVTAAAPAMSRVESFSIEQVPFLTCSG